VNEILKMEKKDCNFVLLFIDTCFDSAKLHLSSLNI
jgi:hypothetical protein